MRMQDRFLESLADLLKAQHPRSVYYRRPEVVGVQIVEIPWAAKAGLIVSAVFCAIFVAVLLFAIGEAILGI